VPFSISFLALQRNGLFGDGLVHEAVSMIDDSIANYGFAQVRIHPRVFAQADPITGNIINEVDNIKFQELIKIVDSLAERSIRVTSFTEIYPSSTTPL
jgi:hypothetical protein